jgi:quinol monooxygenase YgiN
MYAISYRFVLMQPNEANQKEFVRCWSGITEFFKQNAGALGSRLHRGEDGAFYAYAQWPDKATFEAAGNILPTEDFVRLRMAWAELCEPSEILWAGEVSEDLLEG